jgi:hypothetical protein
LKWVVAQDTDKDIDASRVSCRDDEQDWQVQQHSWWTAAIKVGLSAQLLMRTGKYGIVEGRIPGNLAS